jgi:hypothetical protein
MPFRIVDCTVDLASANFIHWHHRVPSWIAGGGVYLIPSHFIPRQRMSSLCGICCMSINSISVNDELRQRGMIRVIKGGVIEVHVFIFSHGTPLLWW